MKLLFAGLSPYVRKVNMTAEVKGLSSEIELVASDAPGSDALRAQNPLGKIPVLLRDDGPAIFDSHVICEYLDSGEQPSFFPGRVQRGGHPDHGGDG